MGVVLRTALAFYGFVAVGVLALLYGVAMKPLIKLGGPNGAMSGTFSATITRIDTLIPLLVAALAAAVGLYWIIGSVRDERRVRRRQQ